MSILQKIIEHKADELKSVKSSLPLSELKAAVEDAAKTVSFMSALKRPEGEKVRLIAELKKASPSRGLIRDDFDPDGIISIYDKKDVSAISVLTESRYFQGSLDYLKSARGITEKPLLRKDFIFEEYQIYEARAFGSDALLLIVAALERSQLQDLMGLAGELSLDCLIEVHNHRELETALICDSGIVGINNRNLKTLDIDLKTTFELLKDIPKDKIVISESGLDTRADVEALEGSRVDAMLIGTTIMRSNDIGAKIDELMGRA